MATKNVTVIFDRKGKVLKNGSGEVEIRIYLSRNQCWRFDLLLIPHLVIYRQSATQAHHL